MATNPKRPVFDLNAASASAAMVTGRQYRFTGTANLTATSFTGSTEGSEIVVFLEACDGSHTFTFPSSKRLGDANSATTVVTPTAGNHTFFFKLINGTWYYTDTVSAVRYAADAGANDSYAITVANYTAYAAGDRFEFKANTANTGAATLNVNSIGAVTIKKFTSASPGADLADNDIRAGQIVTVVYDGTNFQMLSALGNAGGGSGDAVLANNQTWTGTNTFNKKVTLGSTQTASAWTTGGIALSIPAASYTDSSSSGTVAVQAVDSSGIPTLLASSSTTYTDSFTKLILGAPVASTNVTQTRAHSFGIQDSTTTSSSITGAFVVANTIGTSATSVSIGNGKIYTGGAIVIGGGADFNGSLTFSSSGAGLACGNTGGVNWNSSKSYIKSSADGTIEFTNFAATSGATLVSGGLTASSATVGIGYTTGAGGTVTQTTSRTTGVTLNKTVGQITLVSAAGSTSWQTFTVTNSSVAANDVIIINQKSGTDLNEIHITAVAAGSFNVSFKTTGGTTTEQPVFTFAIIKGAAA